ncbi:hypothetical protein DVH05_010130 [Phytophthora capsici]|nr:hypothetical protein DVH05_010130 [Phytophthora capsici]
MGDDGALVEAFSDAETRNIVVVAWLCEKQSCVALPTMESERRRYYRACKAHRHASQVREGHCEEEEAVREVRRSDDPEMQIKHGKMSDYSSSESAANILEEVQMLEIFETLEKVEKSEVAENAQLSRRWEEGSSIYHAELKSSKQHKICLASSEEISKGDDSNKIRRQSSDQARSNQDSLDTDRNLDRGSTNSYDDQDRSRFSDCGPQKHTDLGCCRHLTHEKCGKQGLPVDRCLFLLVDVETCMARASV